MYCCLLAAHHLNPTLSARDPPAGGTPYELGPFVSALEAARAFDRYSILLHGATAEVGCNGRWLWLYLADRASLFLRAPTAHT